MNNPIQLRFDYGALDSDTRQFAQQKAEETRVLLKRTAEHILQIGKNLKAVKDKLPHGQFLPWVHAEFDMTERHARTFMQVAARFDGKSEIISDLPVTVIYALASPSTDETIVEAVTTGQTPATLQAIREAKEELKQAQQAERQARTEVQALQQQLITVHTAVQTKQSTIDTLTHDLKELQAHLATMEVPKVQIQIQEVEKQVVPPEMKDTMEQLQHTVTELTKERDQLAKQAKQLGDEARAAWLKANEGEQERRIRLNWYQITSEFHRCVTKILGQWPTPLDVLAFEADEWTRLSQTKELARRFLEECQALTGSTAERIVEGSAVYSKETHDATTV